MATVEKCSYCNRDMSSDFHRCPHCKKVVPRPASCEVCEKELNSSKSISFSLGNKRESAKFYHQDCYKKVLDEYHCPTCKEPFPKAQQEDLASRSRPYPFYYDQHFIPSCLNCGQQKIYYAWCRVCSLAVITENTAGEYAGKYHHICAHGIEKLKQKVEKERQEEEKKEALEKARSRKIQIANGVCSCGMKLEFFDKLLGREKHRYCK